MSHHLRREQRNAKVIAVVVVALLLAVSVPLIVSGSLRLRVAERFGWVAHAPRERIARGADAGELVILVQSIPVQFSLPTLRYTATYVAFTGDDGVTLLDLATNRDIPLPLQRYDLVSAASDNSAVLFVDHDARPSQAVLVTVATGEVRPLPPGDLDPGIPGAWDQDVFQGGAACDGVSPKGDWVACANSSPRLAGDWQIVIHPAGKSREAKELLRGLGSVPILGWAADERAIYYQNETGVWKVPVDLTT